MKTATFILFASFSLCSALVRAQNSDTTVEARSRWALHSIGVDGFFAEHVGTALLEGYAYNYSTPKHMQGISVFFHSHPFPKWKFGMAYTGAVSRCLIDLRDMPPYDTVLSMQQSIFALDAQYLLMQKKDVHTLWLSMRAGFMVLESAPYFYYDSLPGQYGFPDYTSGHTVYPGEGIGGHAQLTLRYNWKVSNTLSIGCRAGASGNYIHHETTFTGNLSTPWWPGMNYTSEEEFDVLQYFIHTGIDVTIQLK